jgi:hypothetical protein
MLWLVFAMLSIQGVVGNTRFLYNDRRVHPNYADQRSGGAWDSSDADLRRQGRELPAHKLRMPIVTTVHTILGEPEFMQRRSMVWPAVARRYLLRPRMQSRAISASS